MSFNDKNIQIVIYFQINEDTKILSNTFKYQLHSQIIATFRGMTIVASWIFRDLHKH